MISPDFSNLPERVLDWKSSGERLHVPRVAKAGSSSSPAVLSPGDGCDFFLNAATVLSSTRKTTPGVSSSQVPSSIASPLPLNQQAGTLPLFSPSEFSPAVPRGASSIVTEAAVRRSIYTSVIPTFDHSLPTPPDNEPNRLRLPSFEMLGIAAPHPDNYGHTSDKELIDAILPDCAIAQSPFNKRPTLRKFDRADLGMDHMSASLLAPPIELDEHSAFDLETPPEARGIDLPVDVLTPPDDDAPELPLEMKWMPPLAEMSTSRPSESQEIAAAGSGASVGGITSGLGSVSIAAQNRPSDSTTNRNRDALTWLEDAIQSIIISINTNTINGRSLQVLSHALPSPSFPGHAFPDIINRVRISSPSSPVTWVNLLHAVPGRFNLADLPTTPPATPGQPYLGGGDDYFTTKVFNSAVTTADYESQTAPPQAVRHNPLAAPESINLSIVERYIPPASSAEFSNLFSVRGTSLLVDRLIELAPGNGCLVFIYPTLAGGNTFANQYLGPILDPLLRSLVVVNNFSSDLSESLGRMTAVSHLLPFEIMKSRTAALCEELNSNFSHVRSRLQKSTAGQTGAFELVYAEKHEITLERRIWSTWWIKQEKTRVRNVVAKYFRQGRGVKDIVVGENGEEVMPVHLVQEVLDGVEKRAYAQEFQGPGAVEVGVFVVRRGKE